MLKTCKTGPIKDLVLSLDNPIKTDNKKVLYSKGTYQSDLILTKDSIEFVKF